MIYTLYIYVLQYAKGWHIVSFMFEVIPGSLSWAIFPSTQTAVIFGNQAISKCSYIQFLVVNRICKITWAIVLAIYNVTHMINCAVLVEMLCDQTIRWSASTCIVNTCDYITFLNPHNCTVVCCDYPISCMTVLYNSCRTVMQLFTTVWKYNMRNPFILPILIVMAHI